MAGPMRYDMGPLPGLPGQRRLLAAILRRGRAYALRNAERLPSPLGSLYPHAWYYAQRVAGYGQTLGYGPAWDAAYNVASNLPRHPYARRNHIL